MKRFVLWLFVSLGVLMIPPLALASDASLKGALKPYEGRLTTDIGYLSSFSASSRSAADLRQLAQRGSRGDLFGATRAASHQQASSSSGRKGRTLVLSALADATVAAGDARASAIAARSGNRSAAKRYGREEQSGINKAIPLFESGSKLLHLF
jgi:hypothetical protein